jgi:hypothetical protein
VQTKKLAVGQQFLSLYFYINNKTLALGQFSKKEIPAICVVCFH